MKSNPIRSSRHGVKPWIEAMRLRTLPVSVSGVLVAVGYARLLAKPEWLIFIICLAFAVVAQISSNFANEYFDFKNGIDRPGRQGPRRGVTEGDISPGAMLRAVVLTLFLAALLGLSLIYWGGWRIVILGVCIILGVGAYSAGPFPFSRNCLGEVAAIVFFGVIPVTVTFWLMTGYIDPKVWGGSLAVGLMSANVLLVNNIRDIPDDRLVGKHTIASVLGRKFASFLYLANGWVAVWLVGSAWIWIGGVWQLVLSLYLFLHTVLWYCLDRRSRKVQEGDAEAKTLTPFLGMTACLMAAYAICFVIAA